MQSVSMEGSFANTTRDPSVLHAYFITSNCLNRPYISRGLDKYVSRSPLERAAGRDVQGFRRWIR